MTLVLKSTDPTSATGAPTQVPPPPPLRATKAPTGPARGAGRPGRRHAAGPKENDSPTIKNLWGLKVVSTQLQAREGASASHYATPAEQRNMAIYADSLIARYEDRDPASSMHAVVDTPAPIKHSALRFASMLELLDCCPQLITPERRQRVTNCVQRWPGSLDDAGTPDIDAEIDQLFKDLREAGCELQAAPVSLPTPLLPSSATLPAPPKFSHAQMIGVLRCASEHGLLSFDQSRRALAYHFAQLHGDTSAKLTPEDESAINFLLGSILSQSDMPAPDSPSELVVTTLESAMRSAAIGQAGYQLLVTGDQEYMLHVSSRARRLGLVPTPAGDQPGRSTPNPAEFAAQLATRLEREARPLQILASRETLNAWLSELERQFEAQRDKTASPALPNRPSLSLSRGSLIPGSSPATPRKAASVPPYRSSENLTTSDSIKWAKEWQAFLADTSTLEGGDVEPVPSSAASPLSSGIPASASSVDSSSSRAGSAAYTAEFDMRPPSINEVLADRPKPLAAPIRVQKTGRSASTAGGASGWFTPLRHAMASAVHAAQTIRYGHAVALLWGAVPGPSQLLSAAGTALQTVGIFAFFDSVKAFYDLAVARARNQGNRAMEQAGSAAVNAVEIETVRRKALETVRRQGLKAMRDTNEAALLRSHKAEIDQKLAEYAPDYLQAQLARAAIAPAQRDADTMAVVAGRGVLQGARAGFEIAKLTPVLSLTAAGATIAGVFAPAISAVTGVLQLVQGALDWRKGTAELARVGASKRSLTTDALTLSSLGVDAPADLTEQTDYQALQTLYRNHIHPHMVASQAQATKLAKTGKAQAYARMVYGALSTPVGAAAVGLTITGVAIGTAGIALAAVAGALALGWSAYTIYNLVSQRRASQAQREADHAMIAQADTVRGLPVERIEQALRRDDQAHGNKYLAAVLLQRHLRAVQDGPDSNAPAPTPEQVKAIRLRRKVAVRYLRETGMPEQTIAALRAASGTDQRTVDLVVATIEAHLFGTASGNTPALSARSI